MSRKPSISLEPLIPLFADWCQWDSELVNVLTDVHADFNRRHETRGPSFFTLDLPLVDKVYCKGLSSGHLAWLDMPKSIGKPRSGSPLTRLLLRQFSSSGESLDPCPNSVFFMRTLLNLWKKAPKEFSSAELEVFYERFLQTDMELRSPNLNWGAANLDFSRLDRSRALLRQMFAGTSLGSRLYRNICYVADALVSKIPELTSIPMGAHGPGAVAEGGRYRDKYDFATWGRKLSRVFDPTEFASHDFSVPSFNVAREPTRSRVVAVPKTWKGPRLITIEPQAYVFCQKALLTFLRDHFPAPIRRCYSVNSQVPSQEHCTRASVTAADATVDLSEASDRLSCFLIEALFSSHTSLLRALNACRMHVIENPNTGRAYRLKKYAGMGNATTFPIQSMVYAIICIASVITWRGMPLSWKSIHRASSLVRVFGDDLIVPSDCVPALDLALRSSQLKVNLSKTHFEGHFRESCGKDAYYGHDVTPFYMLETFLDVERIKRNPEVLSSWVEVSNNAYKKGLWYTADWMRKKVQVKHRKLIPVTQDQSFGLRFHCHQSADGPLCVRPKWSEDLQRDTYRVALLQTRAERVERDSDLNLLQYFVEVPEKEEVNPFDSPDWRAGWTRRAGLALRTGWV